MVRCLACAHAAAGGVPAGRAGGGSLYLSITHWTRPRAGAVEAESPTAHALEEPYRANAGRPLAGARPTQPPQGSPEKV